MTSHFPLYISFFFFFNYTATTEIYTLSLHDALPISPWPCAVISESSESSQAIQLSPAWWSWRARPPRSEEHTSELQSQSNLVCRLLLEKKKKQKQQKIKQKKIKNTNTQQTKEAKLSI